MTMPDLVDRLVADLKPVPAGFVARRLALGIAPGIAVSAILMLALIGPRPQLAAAMATPGFWVKVAYAALLALAASAAVLRMARPPAGFAAGAAMAALAAFAVLVVLALIQVASAPPAASGALVFGTTALVCPWLILFLSLPIFAGAFWALRGLAPTRLTSTGAAAGLLAGAYGALVYSFHCYESAMPFVAIWYTAGIVIAGLVGAALGRWLLRW